MKKESEIKLLLVYKAVYPSKIAKMLYSQSSQITKSEGNAIKVLSVKLTSEELQKLNELIEKVVGEEVNKCEFMSEKLRKFIDNLYSELIGSNKQEFLTSIQSDNPPYEQLPMTQKELAEACNYHTINEKGEWYCDIKKIPKVVCIQRQKRHLAMNRRCRPEHLKKKGKPKGERLLYGKPSPYGYLKG